MLSRVADSLYWMSRYIERAENNARLADVNLQLLLDLANQPQADTQQQWNPIISSLEENELFASLYDTLDGTGRDRFRQPAEKKSELDFLLPVAGARKRAHHARANFERNVGANQSALSFS